MGNAVLFAFLILFLQLSKSLFVVDVVLELHLLDVKTLLRQRAALDVIEIITRQVARGILERLYRGKAVIPRDVKDDGAEQHHCDRRVDVILFLINRVNSAGGHQETEHEDAQRIVMQILRENSTDDQPRARQRPQLVGHVQANINLFRVTSLIGPFQAIDGLIRLLRDTILRVIIILNFKDLDRMLSLLYFKNRGRR